MGEQRDWSRFIVRINIRTTPDELYRCWATRAGIESWFLRLSEYRNRKGQLRDEREEVEKGDSYKWLWHGWPDDTVEHGTILEANGRDLISFSFGKAGNCRVRIYQEFGEQLLELVQEDIPVDDHGWHTYHVGCKTGWTFYLANLKSICEGGIDLRNRNEQLEEMLNS